MTDPNAAREAALASSGILHPGYRSTFLNGYDAGRASRDADVAGHSPTLRTEPDGFRVCEYCGCNTNARIRACCNAGRQADAPRTEVKGSKP